MPACGDVYIRRSVTAHAAIVMLAAVGLGIVRYLAGDSSTPHYIVGCARSPRRSSPVSLPHFSASGGHPTFVAAAGIGLWPISLVSIVMWPLLIPAGFLAWKGLQAAATRTVFDVLVSIAIVAAPHGWDQAP